MSATSSAEILASINPTTGAEIVRFRPSGRQEVRAAVDAAQGAAPAWAAQPPLERARLMHEAADSLHRRQAQLVHEVVAEVGKPVREAREELARCTSIIRYHAGAALDPSGSTIPELSGQVLVFTLRQPLGHVGLITPWNFPYAIPLWKLAPALAYGNTVVVKPAPQATAAALQLAEFFGQLPPGVLTVLPGGVDSGRLLADSPLGGLSFTGSTAAGSAVARSALATGARFQAELGGKNASVVLADADLEHASTTIALAAMSYAGQKCTATSRVVVERSIAPTFRKLLVEKVRQLRVDDPAEDTTDVGPLIDEDSVQRVHGFVQRAVSAGADVLMGGEPMPALGKCFYAPTVMGNVSPDSELAMVEVFGPILAVLEADGPDDALRLANCSTYGLASAVFTKSLSQGLRFARRLEAGLVKVNDQTPGVIFNAPFDPSKGSGIGWGEQGKTARLFFTRERTVSVADAS